jgi:poly(hydroxyalkanoate) depolymerase family esterase
MIDPNQGGGGSTRRADGNLRTMLLPLPGQHHLCGQCLVTLLPARRAGRTIEPRRDEMQALRVGCWPRRWLTGIPRSRINNGEHESGYAEQMLHGVTFLAILLLIAAAYAYYWYSPAPLLPPLSARIRQNTVRVGDRDRTYLIYVPANLPQQAALVIVLHGSEMDGARMRLCTGYEFDCLADEHGFVVLYPDGYRRNWNDCRKYATFPAKRENIDDMSFIRTMIKRVIVEQAIDQKRVYVFGYSNGGHMAFRLAMEAPNEIAAVAAIAASLPTPDASSRPQQGRTSRVTLINGTADPINPYQGGTVTLFGLAGRGTVM